MHDEAAGVVRELIRAFTDGELAAVGGLIADDAVYHGPPVENLAALLSPGSGKATYLRRLEQLRDALSGRSASLSAVVQADDLISCVIEYRGVHHGRYLNIDPTGRDAVVLTSNTFRLRAGRIIELWHNPDRFSFVDQVTGVLLRDDPVSPAPAEIAVALPPGTFPECIAIDQDGTLYVTLMFQNQIVRVRPGQSLELFYEFQAELIRGDVVGPSCMVFGPGGELYVNVVSNNSAAQGIWQFATEMASGRRIAAIPVPAFPNGLAIDQVGRLYAADSLLGLIWRVDRAGAVATVWSRDPLLAARPVFGLAPGANGIQVWNDSVYVTVSDTARLLRVPILDNGCAGLPEVVATDIPGDDFAIDDRGNFYVTTHPYNRVIRLNRNGSREIIATAEQGVSGCTYAKFGVTRGDERNLYVAADGGLLHAPAGRAPNPAVIRLSIRD